jgi:transposase
LPITSPVDPVCHCGSWASAQIGRTGERFGDETSALRVSDHADRNDRQCRSYAYRVSGCRQSTQLSKIGRIKIKPHRPIDGTIKTLTITREAGEWFAYFSVEVDPAPLPASAESISVDVGLSHFATLSDGTQIANPRHARRAAARMRRAQRRIARWRRGSAGRREAVRLCQAAHAHVRHQRADMHHTLARSLVDRYGFIAVEDLNSKDWPAACSRSRSTMPVGRRSSRNSRTRLRVPGAWW